MQLHLPTITLDKKQCIQCRRCINRMKDYCISEKNGYPVFDYSICNVCQKCVAICPNQAILVNNIPPKKIEKQSVINPEDLYELFRKRRSIKIFQEKELDRSIIQKIVDSAKFAPNQNKNIDVIIIDDRDLIKLIDKHSLLFIKKIYMLLFSFKPLTWFFNLFTSELPVIRKKMEYNLFTTQCIVKKGTQAIIMLTGNKKVPTTVSSAHYLFAAMIYYAESLCIGTCLMDSLKISIGTSSRMKKKLNIKSDILGVLSLGYSGEHIVNIPQGYELKVRWNTDES